MVDKTVAPAGRRSRRMALARPLWPHQEKALAAFEEGRNRHAATTYLVVPPGGGKTLIGLEAVRRLGRPVVCPNTASRRSGPPSGRPPSPRRCIVRAGAEPVKPSPSRPFGLRGLTEPAPPLGSAPIR